MKMNIDAIDKAIIAPQYNEGQDNTVELIFNTLLTTLISKTTNTIKITRTTDKTEKNMR